MLYQAVPHKCIPLSACCHCFGCHYAPLCLKGLRIAWQHCGCMQKSCQSWFHRQVLSSATYIHKGHCKCTKSRHLRLELLARFWAVRLGLCLHLMFMSSVWMHHDLCTNTDTFNPDEHLLSERSTPGQMDAGIYMRPRNTTHGPS